LCPVSFLAIEALIREQTLAGTATRLADDVNIFVDSEDDFYKILPAFEEHSIRSASTGRCWSADESTARVATLHSGLEA
jgi:hypothetical protein